MGRQGTGAFVTDESNKLNQYTDIMDGKETFIPEYDMDGNQTRIKTSTGIWTAAYNAQNRPVRFTRENTDGTRTVITAAYDYMGRRAWKKVETIATDPETGEETATITLHQRYIYRGYLQVTACDLMRGGHPCLWLITWDPTQPMATRPLAIQKDGTWYCYGWDLTKNICEVFGQAGYIRTTYSYTPYGSAMEEGDVTQPLQWSSEYADPELSLVYYNYRYYNPTDGRWIRRDPCELCCNNLYTPYNNSPFRNADIMGRDVWVENGWAAFGFHQRICVTTWEHANNEKPCCKSMPKDRYCVSFATKDPSRGSSCASDSSSHSSGSHGSSSDSSNEIDNGSVRNNRNGKELAFANQNFDYGILPPGMDRPLNPVNNNGVVYEDAVKDNHGERALERKTTCEEDMKIYDYLRSLVGLTSSYRFYSQNCRCFSHSTFNEISRKLDEKV